MVRVSHRELIDLLQNALRAVELEAEVRVLEQQASMLRAQNRARELVSVRPGVGVVPEVPLTAAGELHEPAFVALVEAQVWEQRERQLAEITGGAS